jgi:hypothetical protein
MLSPKPLEINSHSSIAATRAHVCDRIIRARYFLAALRTNEKRPHVLKSREKTSADVKTQHLLFLCASDKMLDLRTSPPLARPLSKSDPRRVHILHFNWQKRLESRLS